MWLTDNQNRKTLQRRPGACGWPGWHNMSNVNGKELYLAGECHPCLLPFICNCAPNLGEWHEVDIVQTRRECTEPMDSILTAIYLTTNVLLSGAEKAATGILSGWDGAFYNTVKAIWTLYEGEGRRRKRSRTITTTISRQCKFQVLYKVYNQSKFAQICLIFTA